MRGIILIFTLVYLFISCSTQDVPISYQDQLNKDLATIDSYLATNGITAQTDPDGYGLRYVVNTQGTGIKPVLIDSIKVNYTLKYLSSGQEIQKTPMPFTFLLTNLIPAWQIAFPLFAEGTKATLYVPSGLAYGTNQISSIPPNSNLIFDVELVKVIPDYVTQLKKDVATIDALLTSGSITAQKDASGLRYVVTADGAGVTPSLADSVKVIYTGKILSSGVVFDQSSTGAKFSMAKVVPAWRIAFPLFKQGTRATLYVPSGLGYGAYGTTGVPAATNLLYDIELVRVIKK